MPTIKYSSYLEINPSFESVVDIDADKRQPTMWRDYIVGDDITSSPAKAILAIRIPRLLSTSITMKKANTW